MWAYPDSQNGQDECRDERMIHAGVSERVGWPCVVLLAVVSMACRQVPSDGVGQAPRLSVVVTMSILGDFASGIGGDHVDVRTIVPVGGDPHTYEPVPSDAVALADADVVVANGLGLEPWFLPLSSHVTGELVFAGEALADPVQTDKGLVDPHLWMVPPFVADGYVPEITRALASAAPHLAGAFEEMAEALRQRLYGLDEDLRAQLDVLVRRDLVTSHDAYSYFADHYGLNVVATVIGVTTEEDPSARHIASVVDTIRRLDVPTIFLETTINPALIEQVARDAGVRIGEPLYGDSVGPPGSGAEHYESMMRWNVRAIIDGLGTSP